MNAVTKLNNFEKKVTELNEYMVKYIDDFLSQYEKRSKSSYINYKCDINKLARDLFNYDDYKFIKRSDLESLTVDNLIDYFNSSSEEESSDGIKKYSNQTINRRMSNFKSLIRYLVARNKIEFPIHEMTVLLKALPKTMVGSDVLTHDDAIKCLEFFKNLTNRTAKYVYLMAKLSIDTGLRANEMLTLTWKQFRRMGESVTIRSLGETKGKGHKDWKMTISNEFFEEILQLKEDGVPTVFNVSYSNVVLLMREAVEELGLTDSKYTFHSFRKRAVTNAYNESKDIRQAKEVARHNSIATTELYINEVTEGVKGFYSKGNDYNSTLYKEVSHEKLIEAIEKLGGNSIHNLNILLNDLK